MPLKRSIMAFAGFMFLLLLALAFFVHPYFYWLAVFVGFFMAISRILSDRHNDE